MDNKEHYLKKELDELLRSDSDIFSFIESSSLDGIWYWNLQNPEDEYMSPNFWKLFGYDPTEKKHLASEWQDMINAEDLKAAIENFNKHLADPSYPYDQIVRYTHKDGSTVWVRCRGIAIRDKDGKPKRMLGAHNDYTPIKRAEEQERAKHQQLSSILDASLDGIMAFQSVYNKDGEIVDFLWTLSNKKSCDIVGIAEEDLLGKKLSEIMPGNFEPLESLNNKSLFEYYKDVVKTGNSVNLEFYFQNDGFKDWFHNKAVKHEDGFVVTFNSITDAKNTKLKLEKSEFQWRTAIEANGDGLWDWNLQTDEIYFSPQYKSMLGYKDDELSNTLETFKGLCHPQHLNYVFDELTNYLEAKRDRFDVKFQLKCKDGSYKWIQGKGTIASRSADGTPLRVLGTHRDITKEYEKDLELKKLTRQLTEAQHTAKLGSWSYDIVEDKLEWSDEIFNIFGIDKKAFTPSYEGFLSVIHPDDKEKVNEAFKDSVKSKKPYTVEHRIVTQDAIEKFVREKGYTSYDESGKAIQTIGTVQDISEEIKQQQKLKEAKESAERANQAKSTFLANMSHEIRTPLNGIIGLTDLALQTDLNEIQKEYLVKSKISSKALLHVINDILDYSKIEAGKLEILEGEFSFDELLTNVNDLFGFKAYEKNITLNFFIDHTIPTKLIGDSLRITQILNNLVGNSLKFTQKGDVTISIDKTAIDKKSKKVGLKICVKDSGIGISAQKQKKLFHAFEQGDNSTTKEFGGTGLGLIISKQLVDLMGGQILMESQEGKGTTFCIDLTLNYTQENRSFDKVKKINKKRFLIVDDSSLDREYIQNILHSWDIDSLTASDGIEALKILEKENIDYAFVDWYMPNMDGVELLKALKNKGLALEHIFMITAHDSKELLEKAKNENIEIEKILHKPYTPSSLYNLLVDNKEVFEHKDDEKVIAKTLTKSKTALVAEDNEINQIVIKEILHNLGFEVEIANDGQEALNMASKISYDIILMDLQMPVMDGFESTKKIREFDTTTPIYALSAAVMKEDKELTKQAGMDGHLSKPIDKNQLYDILQKHFEFEHSHDREQADEKTFQNIDLKVDGIDMDELTSRVHSNEEFIKKMLSQFYSSHKETPQKLKEIDINSKEFNDMMHVLKGITGNMSMSELYTLSKEIYESKDIEFKKSKLPLFLEKLQRMLKKISSINQNTNDEKTPSIPKKEAFNILQKYLPKISSASYIDETQKNELYSAVCSLSNVDVANNLKESIDIFDYSAANDILDEIMTQCKDGSRSYLKNTFTK